MESTINQEVSQECIAAIDAYIKAINDDIEKATKRTLRTLKALSTVMGDDFVENFHNYLEECGGDLVGITRIAEGDKESAEEFGFPEVYIDQYVNGGYTGDTFEGHIFVPITKGRFIKIYYSM